MSNFNQLYKIANAIAPYAKEEYGNSFIGFQKLKNLVNRDHLVQLLMSKVNTEIGKIKVLYITFFILNRNINREQIENILNNLYVLTVYLYEDKNKIEVECDECGGSGEQECRECLGAGRVDCRTCDGEGEIECYDCYGEQTEECRCCDGNGTETEEDDEGEEIEVSCSCCDGKGTEDCRSCGGQGSFECEECGANGTERCDECGGYGQTICDYCSDGYVESDEEYYIVERRAIVMYGTNAQEYLGKIMTIDEYSEIEYDDEIFEYEFTLNSRYTHEENYDYEEKRRQYDMDDDFVQIEDLVELEKYKGPLNFK